MYKPKNDKVLISLFLILFFLVGISIGLYLKDFDAKIKEDNNQIKEDIKSNDKEDKIISNNEEAKEKNIVNEKVNVNKTEEKVLEQPKKEISQEKEVVKLSNKDEVVIESLTNTLESVQKNQNNEDFSKKAKSTFVSLVDFLFYDGSIKGVTFKELTDTGKSKVLELASKIDTIIESKIPGYKESISSTTSKAFTKAGELIKSGANNLNYFLENHLTNEEYNSIISAKEELKTNTKNAASFIKDVGSNLFSSTKDKLNNWYQEWKNK